MKSPTSTTSRRRIRIVVLAIVAANAMLAGLFFGGKIREPYPVVILPSFDQVLTDRTGTITYTVPLFHIRYESGRELFTPVSTLLSDVKYCDWLVGRLLPPPNQPIWKPTLPSYGYVFNDPPRSDAFARFVSSQAQSHATSLNESIEKVDLIWTLRHIKVESRKLRLLSPEILGVVNIPVDNAADDTTES